MQNAATAACDGDLGGDDNLSDEIDGQERDGRKEWNGMGMKKPSEAEENERMPDLELRQRKRERKKIKSWKSEWARFIVIV